MSELDSFLEPVYRVNKDFVKLLRTDPSARITDTEARFLVDMYYQMQGQRIRTNNRVKQLFRDSDGDASEPHSALDWVLSQTETVEKEIKKLMAVYVETHEMSWFFHQTCGIGPILFSGLLAHIDIRKAPTAGHIWAFAGLDPTKKWEKKQKRPHNAQLKTLCWKIGESFMKVSNNPRDFYGKVWRERKTAEWHRNLSGELADQAAEELEKKNIGKSTDAYAWYSGKCSPDLAREQLEAGNTLELKKTLSNGSDGVPMLPPAHINARAKRYAVKLFLSHLQYCWWETIYGEKPPYPYVMEHAGHAHFIEPPQKRADQ